MTTYIIINLENGKAVKSYINDYESARKYMDERNTTNWYLVEVKVNDDQVVKGLNGCQY